MCSNMAQCLLTIRKDRIKQAAELCFLLDLRSFIAKAQCVWSWLKAVFKPNRKSMVDLTKTGLEWFE